MIKICCDEMGLAVDAGDVFVREAQAWLNFAGYPETGALPDVFKFCPWCGQEVEIESDG